MTNPAFLPTMIRTKEQVDEYLLAAYLSGNLPRSLRSEISAYLVRDEQARDLLTLAGHALDGAQEGDGARMLPPPVVRPPRPSATTDQSLWKLIIVVSVTVLLLTAAFAWHIVADRPASAPVPVGWTVELDVNSQRVTWPAVPEAVTYRVVLQDPDTGIAFTAGTTQGHAFEAGTSGLWQDARLTDGRATLWLEALDRHGVLIGRTPGIRLVH